MPDSLSDLGLQVFASKLVIKFTKIQATAPCSRSASLLTFPKPPRFLHRKHSLLRATVTRVGDTVQQRRVCKQRRHFRFALFPFSAANLDPAFSIWACFARSGAIGSGAYRSGTRSVLPRSPFGWEFVSKAEFVEQIKYLCGKRCPQTHHCSSQAYGNLPAGCIDEGSLLDTTSRYVSHLTLSCWSVAQDIPRLIYSSPHPKANWSLLTNPHTNTTLQEHSLKRFVFRRSSRTLGWGICRL